MINDGEYYAQILDRAAELAFEGQELRLSYPDKASRDRARMRLYARINQERRKMRKSAPDDPAWGKSPWDFLGIYREGANVLVIKSLPKPLKLEATDSEGAVTGEFDAENLRPKP